MTNTSANPSGRTGRRGALLIMGQLILLVKPLLHIMLAAILLGTAGYLCAIFLTILASQALLKGLAAQSQAADLLIRSPGLLQLSLQRILVLLPVLALLRGLLHYAEQYCNHYIAFKLLAIIRHKVFAALRKLCPAKLEGRDKGNLISIITSDIELLEVFYAHTISPIVIAFLTSLCMLLLFGSYHPLTALFALAAYLTLGVLIPLWNGRRGRDNGMRYRDQFGDLNSFVLDSLRGLEETIQFGQGQERKEQMSARSEDLSYLKEDLSRKEGNQRAVTNLVILLASFGMLFLTIALFQAGTLGFDGVLTCTLAMMGSFGPVVALSSLSNNLNQTLASGERVLSILEESPLVEEIPDESEEGTGAPCCENLEFTGAEVSHVGFSYEEETILSDFSLEIPPGKILGIHGASGSGKSTLLKLLMRFWETDRGRISISGREINRIPTARLRDCEAYVTQETHLFHDSIANNIGIGKPGATREEIIEAAKKASVHDFISRLPEGYDTKIEELGENLSGGECQRIGIARAFLHDGSFLLLDESTSNLDSLNEGMILKSLKEVCGNGNKTVILVSHRKSTMNIADQVYEMDQGRIS